jgi:hypothetical protein
MAKSNDTCPGNLIVDMRIDQQNNIGQDGESNLCACYHYQICSGLPVYWFWSRLGMMI